MSTIPKTREALTSQLGKAYDTLQSLLDQAGPRSGGLACTEDWSLKDLLAVRVWWVEALVEWMEAGQRGVVPELPAAGYTWRETPRLNDDTVRANRRTSLRSLRHRLEDAHNDVVRHIASLNDDALLTPGHFPWAGSYPVARWISMNTTRQYTTAAQMVRKALRAR